MIINGDPLDQLHTLGALDRDQHAAGVTLAGLFEQTGLREHVISHYDGLTLGGGDPVAPLERMNAAELKAWRKLHRLLRSAPLHSRGEVEAVVIHGLKPISLSRLKTGLTAIAKALRAGR